MVENNRLLTSLNKQEWSLNVWYLVRYNLNNKKHETSYCIVEDCKENKHLFSKSQSEIDMKLIYSYMGIVGSAKETFVKLFSLPIDNCEVVESSKVTLSELSSHLNDDSLYLRNLKFK